MHLMIYPAAVYYKLAERCLQQDIYPDLQDLPFQNIKRYDLVSVIKKIEGRQVKEPVKKACSYLNQIYDYAVAMGYCEFNIAHGLNKIAINSKIKKNYPYLKAEDISDFKKNLLKLDAHPIIKKSTAVQITYLACEGLNCYWLSLIILI